MSTGKIDFKDVAFIIPFQCSNNPSRTKALAVLLNYLLVNFDTNIYLKESGGNVYNNEIVTLLSSLEVNYKNIKYFHDEKDYQFFPKTKILNDLLMEVDEQYVVMHDADIVLPLISYVKARVKLMKNVDFVLPFSDDRNHYHELDCDYFFTDAKNFNVTNSINANNCLPRNDIKRPGPPGGVHFLKYDIYVKGFMENENFQGYGPEDIEKILRFKRLGFVFDRVEGPIFHISHGGANINNIKRYKNVGDNEYLMNKISSFNDKELIEYYENQDYYIERKKQLEEKLA